MARVVVCEDDPVTQKLIEVAFEVTAHTVFFAADGLEGLALIERERPDVVITDKFMPRCDGLALADAMRARPHLAHIPIILLTAASGREEIARCYAHGARQVVIKPFALTDLWTAVENACRPDTPSANLEGAR